jgi:hypothetical protein
MDFDRIIWWADRVAIAVAFLGIAALIMWPWEKITPATTPERKTIVKCVPNPEYTQYRCSYTVEIVP